MSSLPDKDQHLRQLTESYRAFRQDVQDLEAKQQQVLKEATQLTQDDRMLDARHKLDSLLPS